LKEGESKYCFSYKRNYLREDYKSVKINMENLSNKSDFSGNHYFLEEAMEQSWWKIFGLSIM
jgi:hypothetical protein